MTNSADETKNNAVEKEESTVEIEEKNGVEDSNSETAVEIDNEENSASVHSETKETTPVVNVENEGAENAGGVSASVEPLDETFQIGGAENPRDDDAVNIDTRPGEINVDAQTPPPETAPMTPQDDEEYKKVATLENPPEDEDGRKKSNTDFKPVGEQDIIDFMYQTYFMGGFNLLLQGGMKGCDTLMNALCGNYNNAPRTRSTAGRSGRASSTAPTPVTTTPTPTTPTPAGASQYGLTQNETPYLEQIDDAARESAKYFLDVLQNMADNPQKIKQTLQCFKENIGKNPENWKAAKIIGADGKEEIVFEPSEHKNFIKRLNAIYNENPQKFNKKLQILENSSKLLNSKVMKNYFIVAAQLAAIEVAAQNPGIKLENNPKAMQKISKKTFGIMAEFAVSATQIIRKNENQYHLLSGAKRDAVHHIIQNKSLHEFEAYLQEIGKQAAPLKNLLVQHYDEVDAGKKQALLTQITKSGNDLRSSIEKHIQPDDSRMGEFGGNSVARTLKKSGLRETATDFNEAEKRESALMQQHTSSVQSLNEQIQAIKQRSYNFQAQVRSMFGTKGSSTYNFTPQSRDGGR